jgi:N-acetylmuramoyl-L-alanine amidase
LLFKTKKISDLKTVFLQRIFIFFPKKSNQFKGLDRIEEYLSNGAHKYLVGSTRSLDDAKKNQKILRDAGFGGAFVVAFENGNRISNEEALKKIQK